MSELTLKSIKGERNVLVSTLIGKVSRREANSELRIP